MRKRNPIYVQNDANWRPYLRLFLADFFYLAFKFHGSFKVLLIIIRVRWSVSVSKSRIVN